MKKFLKITVTILVLLLLSFMGLFKYRQYQANQILIPKDATSLVKISIDELYKSIILNMILHPGYYLSTDKSKQGNKKKDLDVGLKIPAGIYFYSLKNEPKTTLFTKIKIDDYKVFSNFIQNQLHLNLNKQGDATLASQPRGNLAILFSEKYAIIALSTQTNNFEPALKNLLAGQNFIKIDDSEFSSIQNRTEHITFADQDHKGWLNFNSGEIVFRDELKAKNISPANKPTHRTLSSESAITFWLNANLRDLVSKTYKVKTISFERDSLLKYYNGYTDFEWINTTQQTDSVITYDYDDDFNKFEKVTLRKRDVPNFRLNITSDAIGLKNYLKVQQIINADSGLVNNSIFPLYKVFVGGNDENLVLGTNKNDKISETKVATKDFFSLNIDFLKLNKQINQPIFVNYFKDLKFLDIKGKAIENNKISINGKLEMANQNINSLYQLFKGL